MRATTTNPNPSPQQLREQEVEWGSRTVDVYEKIEQIGEGTYGQVYKARNKMTGEIVALKRIRMENEKEGFPITAIREIKILKELNHKNIIKLKEIVVSKSADASEHKKGSIYMVFEYMDHDLAGLLDSPTLRQTGLRLDQIKCYTKQLLEGLHYLHYNNVLHRDIKASNLLINNQGVLKLADFGLARLISNKREGNYTNNVITLWYRPPELLLGAHSYGTAVDMWSVGCILAELLYRKPIFPGKTEIDQLDLIFRLCGTPTDETWPDAKKLPWYQKFAPQKVYKPRLREVFKDFPPSALNLIERLLCLDPTRRLSAADALDSDFFWTEPLPCKPEDMPVFPSSHEFTTRRRKQRMIGGVEGSNGLPALLPPQPSLPPPGISIPPPVNNRSASMHPVGWNNTQSSLHPPPHQHSNLQYPSYSHQHYQQTHPRPPPHLQHPPPPPHLLPLPSQDRKRWNNNNNNTNNNTNNEDERTHKRLKTGPNTYHSVQHPPHPPSFTHSSDSTLENATHRSSHYPHDSRNSSRPLNNNNNNNPSLQHHPQQRPYQHVQSGSGGYSQQQQQQYHVPSSIRPPAPVPPPPPPPHHRQYQLPPDSSHSSTHRSTTSSRHSSNHSTTEYNPQRPPSTSTTTSSSSSSPQISSSSSSSSSSSKSLPPPLPPHAQYQLPLSNSVSRPNAY